MTLRILPITAGVATGAAFLVAILTDRLDTLAGFAAILCAGLILSQGCKGKMAWRVLLWTLPLLVPLFIIHALLNPAYPVDRHVFDLIPFRGSGFAYACLIALRMLLISVVGGYWLSILREDLVEGLMRARLPSPLILLLVQGVGMAGIVSRRLDSVYLAQRARGVPVGGSTFDRLRALPSVLLPVIIGILVEADGRVPALVSQGFGNLRVRPKPPPVLSIAQKLFTLLAPMAALAAIVIAKS